MTTNNDARPSLVRNALLRSLMLLALIGPGFYGANAQPMHRMHRLVSKQTQDASPKLYYRPFCRRSHYVTNPSAPCWN